VTTEGGLDVIGQSDAIALAIEKLHEAEIEVSLFVDPAINIVEQSQALEAEMIELHTGHFANVYAMLNSALPLSHHSIRELELPRDELKVLLDASLERINSSANHARSIGLEVAAGHGLNYQNVALMTNIEAITELNIGQSIIARSVFSGLASAVKEMKQLCQR